MMVFPYDQSWVKASITIILRASNENRDGSYKQGNKDDSITSAQVTLCLVTSL